MTTSDNTQRVSSPHDDLCALKDRARQNVVQTRQTLGAVGRVASRVRTSGLLKVSSLLPKARDGDDDVNSSPWGVGTAAIPKSHSVSTTAEYESKGRSCIAASNSTKRNSDVMNMSSPLSAEGKSELHMDENRKPTKTNSQGTQNANMERPMSPTDTWPQSLDIERSRAPERYHPPRQLPSYGVKPKFTFRPSLHIEATSPSSHDEDSPSPSNLRSQNFSQITKSPTEKDTQSSETWAANSRERDTSISSPVLMMRRSDTNEDACAPKVAFASETTILPPKVMFDEPNKRENGQIVKHLPFGVFGRSKSRPHEGGGQQRKSKAGMENLLSKLKLTRGKSQPAKLPSLSGQEQYDDKKEETNQTQQSPLHGINSHQKHVGAPKTRKNLWRCFLQAETNTERGLEAQSNHPKPRGESKGLISVGPDFFAKAAENGGGTDRLIAAQADESVGEVPKNRNALRMRKKPPKKLKVEDTDDTLESGNDETIHETVVRSLAVDDFISYQTKKNKKGQRSR